METQQQINELQSRQLELRAIMASSDERAAKCFKNGTSFRETYPDDFARYEAANAEYNRNEQTLAEQSTMAETIVQNSTTAILTSIFYQALADSIIWLVVAAVVIVCDLFFGCEAARKRGERVRISRAVRRTVNKMCEYLCWVMLGLTISIGFAADWLKYLIFAIIYGNELSSCLSNYFAAKGKRITFNVFSLLGRRLGIDELEQCHIEEDDRNNKNTANKDDSITY